MLLLNAIQNAAIMSSTTASAASSTFWVCGEVLIDRLPSVDEENNDDDRQQRINVVGGGAANTAKCISRLGYDVQFIDGISNDEYGKLAESNLLEDNVGLDLCWMPKPEEEPKPTCLATVNFDADKKATYDFLIDNTATFAFDQSWLPNFHAADPKPNVLHIGTLATIIEPGASAIYDWCVNGALTTNVPIVFDPNIRPSVMSDRGKYQECVDKFAKISTVVKASDDDLEWLYPDKSYYDVAQSWLLTDDDNDNNENSTKTKLVVVTRGADGMIGYTKNDNDVAKENPMKVVSAEPKVAIDLVDTVGAGDTVGAIITEGVALHGMETLIKDSDVLRSVLDRANLASGITCSREGCKPPSQLDLQTFSSTE